MPRWIYTEGMDTWLLRSYRDHSKDWAAITGEFNERYNTDKTVEALRKRTMLLRLGRVPDALINPAQTSRQTITDDVWVIEIAEGRFTDWREAVEKSGVDFAIWEVERVIINGWDVTAKVSGGSGKPDALVTKQNQQIKVWLRRKVKKPLADAAADLVERMKAHAPKYPAIKHTNWNKAIQ